MAAILTGIITGVISFIIGSGLWFAPWAVKINNKAKDLPIWKNLPVKTFLPWVFIWGLVFSIIMAITYMFVKDLLPLNLIVKGLIYGIVIWVFKNLSEAVNNLLLIDKPINYTFLELANSFIGLSVSGILIAVLFGAFTKSLQ